MESGYELRWSAYGTQVLLCVQCSWTTGDQHLSLIYVYWILSTVTVASHLVHRSSAFFINCHVDGRPETNTFYQTGYWHFYGHDFVLLPLKFIFFKNELLFHEGPSLEGYKMMRSAQWRDLKDVAADSLLPLCLTFWDTEQINFNTLVTVLVISEAIFQLQRRRLAWYILCTALSIFTSQWSNNRWIYDHMGSVCHIFKGQSSCVVLMGSSGLWLDINNIK